MKRDYYEVLGLEKGATSDQIKMAYRKSAIKWHPDKWVNGTEEEKKTAEDKFKEASEAYTVLSDPDKKAKYDQFGFAGVDGQAGPDFSGGFGNLNDILNDLFGGGFSGFSGFSDFGGFGGFGGGAGADSGQRVYRGRDIRTRVSLTLEEIASGCTKEVSIERNVPCSECNGKGAKSESDIQTCPTCGGSGREQRVVNSLFGRTVTYTTCSRCGGEGKIVKNPCHSCNGTGLVRKRETIKVDIPAGVEDQMQVTVRGAGHAAKHNGINGDLLVVIEEKPHAKLKRSRENLFYTRVVSIMDAMLGTELSIPCIDGAYKIKIEAGTQSGTILKLKGKGLPSVRGGSRGDMYVKILVWIPRKLTKGEKGLFESIKDNPSFEPRLSREDQKLYDKESMNF